MERPSLTDSARSSSRSNASILVVDDEIHVCDYCARALRKADYEVVATTRSTAALELLRQQPFDLLLSDIRMPEMTGLELARLAREIDPGIAVVIMTGFTTLEHLREAVQQGVTSYLSKPFELEELRLTVTQALHQRQVLQQNLRLKDLVHVLDVIKPFSRLLSVDALCEEIVTTARSEIGAGCGFVYLTPFNGEPRLVHSGDHESALSEQGMELLHQATDEDEVIQFQGACCGGAEGDVNLIAPLRAHGDKVGALMLSRIPSSGLPRSAVEITSLLATHAGAALRNAQLHEALQLALQNLKELDRLKSEFISIASHELRTPLSIVLGYSMMLREQTSSPQRDYLHRVVDSAIRINDIVDDMINLHHVETGEAKLNLAPCPLELLLGESAAAIEPLAHAKEQRLELDLGDPQDSVVVDREKVALVLVNLLSNAVKFTDRGGQITLKSWFVASPAGVTREVPDPIAQQIKAQPGRWLFVSVCDTGIGISAQNQRRIFDRFYQVANSLTREHNGTGLGLAIVRELIEHHGGSVWVRSSLGEGSTFTFALPQHELVEAEEPGAET